MKTILIVVGVIAVVYVITKNQRAKQTAVGTAAGAKVGGDIGSAVGAGQQVWTDVSGLLQGGL